MGKEDGGKLKEVGEMKGRISQVGMVQRAASRKKMHQEGQQLYIGLGQSENSTFVSPLHQYTAADPIGEKKHDTLHN